MNLPDVELIRSAYEGNGPDRPAGEDADTVRAMLAAYDQLGIDYHELDRAKAEAYVDATTMFRGMRVENGRVVLEVTPSREIAAALVGACRGLLGGAENYCETAAEMDGTTDPAGVELDLKRAGETDRFVLRIQRVGRLTPHEARQRVEAALARVLAVCDELEADSRGARPVRCEHVKQSDCHDAVRLAAAAVVRDAATLQ